MARSEYRVRDITRLIEQRFGCTLGVSDAHADVGALERMLSHRTHRSYSSEPVDQKLLGLLFACALSAPSKSDLQQADIVHVRDPVKRTMVADLIPAMPWIRDAPEFLVFCGNGRRIRQVSALKNQPFANDHLDAFFNAAVDAAIVMTSFIHAAEAAGLGCCPISAVRNHCEAVGDLLSLPEHVFPVAGMCVGYPSGEGRLSCRLPLDITVHTDRFDETSLDQQIDAYDRRRAASMPVSERYLWSEAKAKQYSAPQRTDFGAYIRAKGFNLS